MKKLIILLLLPLTFVAQQKEKKKKKKDPPEWLKHTPGQELKIASNHFYTGFILTVAGSATAALSYKSYGLMTAGGVAALAGMVFLVESNIHIRRAGDLMDERKIGFADNGIGIIYRF